MLRCESLEHWTSSVKNQLSESVMYYFGDVSLMLTFNIQQFSVGLVTDTETVWIVSHPLRQIVYHNMISAFKICVNSTGKFLRKNPSGHKSIQEKGISATGTLGKDKLSHILTLGLATRYFISSFFNPISWIWSNFLALSYLCWVTWIGKWSVCLCAVKHREIIESFSVKDQVTSWNSDTAPEYVSRWFCSLIPNELLY